MKKVRVTDLIGNEIVAKSIISKHSDIILVSEGTILRRDYIEKLKFLHIDAVYIKEEKAELEKTVAVPNLLLSEDIRVESQKKVKHLFEQHLYKHGKELQNLCSVAEKIIDNVLSDKQIIECVTTIRNDSCDVYTHSVNVCALATLLALKMHYDKGTVREIAIGCLLHDIGLRYMLVPYENTYVNLLTDQEQQEFKKHVVYGYEALKQENWLSDLSKNIILSHHEKLDGSGYPLHWNSQMLTDEIKLVCICDAFDSMLSGIGYQQTKLGEVMEYIRVNRRILFDPVITNIFLKVIALYPTGSKVLTTTGLTGVVIKQNNGFADRPVLQIVMEKEQIPLDKPYIIDLTEVHNVTIAGIIED